MNSGKSNSTVDFDLFKHLSGIKVTNGYPVTKLVIQLLTVVAFDVSKFKHNSQAAYWVVARSRDVCDYIHEQINNADTDMTWDSIDRYAHLIPIVEKVLKELSGETVAAQGISYLPNSSSIQDCFNDIDSWAKARKALHDASKHLEQKALHFNNTTVEDTTLRFELLAQSDDFVVANAAVQSAQTDGRVFFKGFQNSNTLLTGLQNILIKLRTSDAPSNPDIRLFACQVVFIAVTVSNILSEGSKEMKNKLRSQDVFNKTNTLLTDTLKHFATSSLADLRKAWDDYKNFLSILAPPVLPAFLTLSKLLSKVQRLYYQRSFTLLLGIKALDGKKGEAAAISSQVIEAFTNAKTALESAATKADPDVSDAISGARTAIKSCLDQLNIEPQWDADLTNAGNDDRVRNGWLTDPELQRKLEEAKKPGNQKPRKSIQIKADNKTLATYTVDEDLPVSTLLCMVKERNPQYAARKPQGLDMDKLAKDIPSGEIMLIT